VLLLLNLDSCYVALPVSSLRSKRSTRSTSKGLSADISMLSSTRSPCEPQEGADCSKDACCSEPSSIHLKEGVMSGVTCNDTNEASCCTSKPSKTSIDQYPGTSVAKLDDSYKAGCGIKTVYTAALGNYHNLKTGSASGIDSCCSSNLDLAVLLSKLGDCASKECCSDNMSEPATGQTITEVYSNQTIDNCCADGGAYADAILDSHCTSDLLRTVVGSKRTRYT
jgi:hypothetical protein